MKCGSKNRGIDCNCRVDDISFIVIGLWICERSYFKEICVFHNTSRASGEARCITAVMPFIASSNAPSFAISGTIAKSTFPAHGEIRG